MQLQSKLDTNKKKKKKNKNNRLDPGSAENINKTLIDFCVLARSHTKE